MPIVTHLLGTARMPDPDLVGIAGAGGRLGFAYSLSGGRMRFGVGRGTVPREMQTPASDVTRPVEVHRACTSPATLRSGAGPGHRLGVTMGAAA